MYVEYRKATTAPSGEICLVLDSTQANDAWMYAAKEQSPAAYPNEMGINVAATTHAYLTSCCRESKYGRYRTMSNMSESSCSQGTRVVTKLVKTKTNPALSSPGLDPPTMIWDYAELPRYRRAMAGTDSEPQRVLEKAQLVLKYATLQKLTLD